MSLSCAFRTQMSPRCVARLAGRVSRLGTNTGARVVGQGVRTRRPVAPAASFHTEHALAPFFGPWAPFFESSPVLARPLQDLHRAININVTESKEAFEVTADVPGVPKESVKVHVDGDLLSLEVQQQREDKAEDEHEGVRYHRSERSSSFARRALRLPDSADFSKIKAALSDGVLTLTIPKKAEEERSQRTIAIE